MARLERENALNFKRKTIFEKNLVAITINPLILSYPLYISPNYPTT